MADQPADGGPQNRPETGVLVPARKENGQFQKGQSGNPGGRPSSAWLVEMLNERGFDGKRLKRERVFEALYATAIDRGHRDHVKAALGLLAYAAGKPVTTLELSGPGGEPVQFESTDPIGDMIRAVIARKAAEQSEGDDGPGAG